MCSKCFRESHQPGSDHHQETKPDRAASAFPAVISAPLKQLKLSASAAIKKEEDPAKKTAANRCLTCRKKVGLTGFQCRCGGTFCGSHRYADASRSPSRTRLSWPPRSPRFEATRHPTYDAEHWLIRDFQISSLCNSS
ncbi:hypothetical protein PR202_ga13749 [Eleusine coracana subsp. coracana]|uniref:AN1-type domain-containing protein n=1 Tax=Eleusine coracana subsp. coracana TaxID=191504 RepID=A0AAV5CFR3_ELECO|nr:hypothetical protein PR202_ga13749 [Eleusine coracana subsp. coracana]